MARNKSASWLDRQKRDPYVKRAKQSGYRCRASFKLLELNKNEKLFRPGMSVVDLGAAPGGWSQAITNILGKNAKIYAVDLLEMAPIDGVNFIKGDFTDSLIQDKLKKAICGNKINWVVSDMAPNLSGIRDADQARMMDLAQAAWEFAYQVLAKEGGFLIKLFQGEEVKSLNESLKKHFKKVAIRKPDASRSQSREIYLLCQGFRGDDWQ